MKYLISLLVGFVVLIGIWGCDSSRPSSATVNEAEVREASTRIVSAAQKYADEFNSTSNASVGDRPTSKITLAGIDVQKNDSEPHPMVGIVKWDEVRSIPSPDGTLTQKSELSARLAKDKGTWQLLALTRKDSSGKEWDLRLSDRPLFDQIQKAIN